MEKIKKFIKENHVYLSLGISALIAAIFAYMGFEKGVQRSDKSKKEIEIKTLKVEAENIILEEKLADEKKSINEISQDVDDILDRKQLSSE